MVSFPVFVACEQKRPSQYFEESKRFGMSEGEMKESQIVRTPVRLRSI